ncbi:thiolase family protein [Thermodesulfobacteriota bacterium]
MREVAVLGVGQSIFGKLPDRRAEDLAREAVVAAVKDAGISARDIQAAYTSRLIDAGMDCQAILQQVGVTNIEMVNVENACAGGSTSVRGVWKDIAYGAHDVGIAIGVESITTSQRIGALLASQDLEGQLGLSMPALFALIARRQMIQYGAKLEDFARVSVKNHRHGCLNPMAQYQKEFTIEDVLNSRMICDPITLFMCCPNTDGAAAVVLCSMDVARKHTANPVKIIGSALLSGQYSFLQDDITISPFGSQTATMAYEMAGVGPEDLHVVELHDAFAPEEILRYEDLGLCERGGGVELLRSGATTLRGRIPVNPSGGLLSLGHPLSASGARVVAEITLQLRGQAGKRQVPGAKVGLAHMLGGVVTGLEGGACGIHILAR